MMNGVANGLDLPRFVDLVRAQLSDLTDEEQGELLDGLEADLAELIAEHGPQALGDPKEYAAELRSAAGLGSVAAVTSSRRSVSQAVHDKLDQAASRWQRFLKAAPGDLDGFYETTLPIWWVLRAVIASWLVAMVFGVTPLTGGLAGIIVTGLAVVLSVQLGRGKLRPGERWRTSAGWRAALVGLNAFAILCAPIVLAAPLAQAMGSSDGSWRQWQQGYDAAQREFAGSKGSRTLFAGGKPVVNVFPYDASGKPLVGVQLFDQNGKALSVEAKPGCVDPVTGSSDFDISVPDPDCANYLDEETAVAQVFYPWLNGTIELLNVFPIPTRTQDDLKRSPTAFTDEIKPTIGEPPFASVPAVMLPGIVVSEMAVPPSEKR